MGDGPPVVVERWIDAPPEIVFSFLVDAEGWTRWQGVEAELEPRPGGLFRVDMGPERDAVTRGEFVDVEADRRVAFTWGFERPGHPLPAGSTLVEIDLAPEEGGTLLRLTHSRLPPESEGVRRGWEHHLDQLRRVAGGEQEAE